MPTNSHELFVNTSYLFFMTIGMSKRFKFITYLIRLQFYATN